MQQSTSCESAQAGTGAVNAPITNTTASTFINRNMAKKMNDPEN